MTTTDYFQSHYIPNTEPEQAEMLATLGLTSIDELFQDIPAEFRNPSLDLPAPLSELEIQQELGALAGMNRPLSSDPSFLGAGSYHHFIPAIVKALMTGRVPDCLYPLPAGGQPGHATGYLRVSDAD